VLNAVFNLIGTRRKVASGNPHTIVSITDDGVGNALVTTEAPHGLTFGDYVFVSGTSGQYDGLWIVGNPTATTYLILDIVQANGVPYTGSSAGTWAAATQHVDTYTDGRTLDTSAWVGQAVLEAWGKGGDGDATTGGGGGAYAKTTLTAPFPTSIVLDISADSRALNGDDDTAIAIAACGQSGNDGGAGGLSSSCTGDVTHSGGNGGTNVGGGGGAATVSGPGQLGEDGDGGTSSANGGLDGSGNNNGGDYVGVIDDGPRASDGQTPGGGGSAGGVTTPGSGGQGQVTLTHYELV
jgi:hypothetical protein